MNIEVSFYKTISSKKPTKANLYDLLTNGQFAQRVEAVRNEPNPERQKELKLALPLFKPSGIFSASDDNSLITHSGFICIDIDKKDNMDIENFGELKILIAEVPYVAYCGLSVREKGFFCIIPIQYPDKHKQHFRSLQMDFARCGVTIDKSSSNIGRKRFVSHDPEFYHNPDAVVYDRLIAEHLTTPTLSNVVHPFMNNNVALTEIDEMIAIIVEKGIDMTVDYSDWFALGCFLINYFGESGRAQFHAISQFHHRYSPSETYAKFNDAMETRYNSNIGTFMHLAHEALITALADFADIPKKLI